MNLRYLLVLALAGTCGVALQSHAAEPLRLEQAVSRALDANPLLAADTAELRAAEARSARGALPKPLTVNGELGSTPKSRTVVKGLRTSGLAWRLFAASSGCGTARCIRTHRSLQHRASGTSCGRRVRA